MYLVELDIFSGRPNPTWILSGTEEDELVDRVTADKSLMIPISADTGGLGYRGYIISRIDEMNEGSKKPKLPSTFRIGGQYDVKQVDALWLLDTSEKPDTEVEDYLREEVQGAIRKSKEASLSIPDLDLERSNWVKCSSNYFTSSSDFSFWNGSSYITKNNCYNYASNKRTNSFAQPGRHSGRQFSGSPTCSKVSTAIIYDGWKNNCQYNNNLNICLVIKPGTNADFHFYRKASDKWCHKPGTTAARNTDNAGRVITNPETCDRGSYTDFCGYYYADNGLINVS